MMKKNRLFLLVLPWAACAIMMIMPAGAHGSTLDVSSSNSPYYIQSSLGVGTTGADTYTAVTIESSGWLIYNAPLTIDSGGTLTNNSFYPQTAPTYTYYGGVTAGNIGSQLNINSGGTVTNNSQGTMNISGGTLTIDSGAAKALENGSSLLPAGIKAVTGSFDRGDPVEVLTEDGTHIARGLAAYSSADAAIIAGRRSEDFEALLGFRGRDEMIHRDDLVLF